MEHQPATAPFAPRGKTALVLGASRPIGRGIARFLGAAGARLILPWFDWEEDAREMIEEFAGHDPDLLAPRVDLRRPDEIALLFRHIEEKYAGLDILINNIERGGMPVVHGPYVEEQWDLEMATTLKAKWWTVHHAMALLKKAPQGVIVTLSSIAGVVGRAGPAGLVFNDGYSAANRGISSFTETWAREGAPTVRVNELMLGFCQYRHAEHTRGWGLLNEEQRRAILDTALLRRSATVDEVVAAVRFLVCDATYMTGAVLRLDGGYVLGASPAVAMPPGVDDV